MNFTVNNRGNSKPASWEKCDLYFNRALCRLESAGAEIIAIASVTPHSRLEERSKGVNVPILSIYDALGAFCEEEEISTLLVLGTMPTMTTPNLVEGVSAYGVRSFYPESDVAKSNVVSIINNLYENNIESASCDIEKIVRDSLGDIETKNVAVCLACTELPVAFGEKGKKPKFVHNDVMYLNSSVIHADLIFSACVE